MPKASGAPKLRIGGDDDEPRSGSHGFSRFVDIPPYFRVLPPSIDPQSRGALEISPAAIDNARENARLNQVDSFIDFRTSLSEPTEPFELVLANILAGVLIEYAKPLCTRVSAGGRLVLSGLVGTDVPGVLAIYKPLLSSKRTEVYSRGDWRTLTFTP